MGAAIGTRSRTGPASSCKTAAGICSTPSALAGGAGPATTNGAKTTSRAETPYGASAGRHPGTDEAGTTEGEKTRESWCPACGGRGQRLLPVIDGDGFELIDCTEPRCVGGRVR